MTWTKLSDDFSDDCWALSAAAFRLHTEGLIWSNRKLLDCRLDKKEMRRWAKHPEAVDELLATGWWKDAGEAYLIVHHSVYQRTKQAVLTQQTANKRNGRKGGRPKGPPRERIARRSGGARKRFANRVGKRFVNRKANRKGRVWTGTSGAEGTEVYGTHAKHKRRIPIPLPAVPLRR